MPYNFASSRPITLVFTHEPRYINNFFEKKTWANPPKINSHFLDFLKKSATRKTRFFPVGRNFDHRLLKRPKIVDFGGPRLRKLFLANL